MAWTNWGFDGTINEAQWAQMAGLLGNGYVAAGNGDCLVTAVGGARSVSVAAGTLYGDGVVSVNSGAETVAMTTPVNGQWYVIALRRTWATNTAALVAIAGATTTTTTPTAPPTSFPTLNTNVGVLTDQPIAWAWCNSANTTVVVYDIRLKAVKSLPPVVANSTERDAKFMSPTQGIQVWRDDLGAVETYFGLYNSSTNPGGRDTAGWYVNDRTSGVLPVKPQTVTFVSSTGSVSALGKITFNSGTTFLRLDNVFSNLYDDYLLHYNIETSASASIWARVRSGGVDNSTNGTYWFAASRSRTNATSVNDGATGATVFQISNIYSAANGAGSGTINIKKPFTNSWTWFDGTIWGSDTTSMYGGAVSGMHSVTSSNDGITIFPSTGTMSGTITIFGVSK